LSLSLRAKVLLPLVFFSVLLAGYFFGYYLPSSRANIEGNYRQATERHLDSVVEGLIPLLLAHQLDTVYENLDALAKKNGNWVGIELYDGDGRLLYPLAAPPPRAVPPSGDLQLLTRRIAYLGMNLGSLNVRVDLAPLLKETRRRHAELLSAMLLVIAAFVVCTAYLLERTVIGPVAALNRASLDLARGRFDVELRKAGSDEIGQLVESFGEMRDSIRRYQAELIERSAELSFKNVLLSTQQETSLDGILSEDRHGVTVSLNGRFAEIWELTGEGGRAPGAEFSLKSLACRVKEPEEFLAKLARLRERRDEHSRDELALKDGRILDMYSSPMVEPSRGNLGRVWYFRDVTERRKLESQLRQAQKMESLGIFAGGIAHDFNNILTAIVGYGNLTLMKMAEDDPHRGNIEHMLLAADRAAHLTRDLLTFGRKQVSEKKVVDLNEVVGGTEKFLKRVIGEDIDCSTRPSELPAYVVGDAHQLEQVLMNFATNARDAMQEGGKFTVTIDPVRLDEEFVAAHGYGRPGVFAMVTVSDTGKGMDRATREHIFDPFFTTKEVGKGTGLGLAVVYGIVKEHDGFISVYSEPGRGTTFVVYLPLVAAQPEERAAEALPVHRGGTETILLAEDDEAVRDITTTVLEGMGYTVIAAVDGVDAVAKYHAHRERIQLLLFDLIMPKKTGKEAFDEIRALSPGVKALFASGYAPDVVRQKVLLEEKLPLLFKPAAPSELLRKVRETLDQ